jgi:hypothetical protein
MSMIERRRRIWVDPFQTRLFVRIALYFVLYQVVLGVHVLLSLYIGARLETLLGLKGVLICLVFTAFNMTLLGAVFIYDAVRFAHRLVGPLHRFRRTIRAVASGDEVELVRLRQGDFLREMKEEFNEMLQALEQRGAVVVKPTGATRNQRRPLPV